MTASARGVQATCVPCDRRFFYQGRTLEQIREDDSRNTCQLCGEKFQLEQRPAPEMRPDQRAPLTTKQIEDSDRLIRLALGGSDDES